MYSERENNSLKYIEIDLYGCKVLRMFFWQYERSSSYWKDLNEDGMVPPVTVYPAGHKNYSLSRIREDLKESRKDVCLPCIDAAPIQSVLGVGMLGDKKGMYRLDRSRVADSLTACVKMGLQVSDRFQLTLLNLNDKGQGDFLKYGKAADLIIIAYVFDRPDSRHPECRQSCNHYLRGAWHDAATESGARVITTYNFGTEVGPDNFAPRQGRENLFRTRPVKTGNEVWDSHRTVLVHKSVLPEAVPA